MVSEIETVEDILTTLENGYKCLENHDRFGVRKDLDEIWNDLYFLLPKLGFYAWIRTIQDNTWVRCFPSSEEAEKALQKDMRDLDAVEQVIWRRFYSKGD